MRVGCIACLVVSILVAGCNLFGVFSWVKNGGEEKIEVKRSMQQVQQKFWELHPGTLESINDVWEHANINWKVEFALYRDRYNIHVIGEPANYINSYQLWKLLVTKIVRRLNIQQPVVFDIDSCFHMLAMPEGGDETVYWYVLHSQLQMLGFTIRDFLYQLVP